MSILLSVNPPYAGWLVDGEKTIEWRKKPLPVGTAYIYETKKNGGCGMVIGEVEIGKTFFADANRVSDSAIEDGKVSRFDLQNYAKGQIICATFINVAIRYTKPVPLSEFERPCPFHEKCFCCKYHFEGGMYEPPSCNYTDVEITRPPQSWCYVEDLKGGEDNWKT